MKLQKYAKTEYAFLPIVKIHTFRVIHAENQYEIFVAKLLYHKYSDFAILFRFFMSREQGEFSIFPLSPLTNPLPLLHECSVAARLFYHSLANNYIVVFSVRLQITHFRYRKTKRKKSALIFAIEYTVQKTNVRDCENTRR